MEQKYQAVLTKDNTGKLVATLLTPESPAPENITMTGLFPLTEQGPTIHVAFVDVPATEAQDYLLRRMPDLLEALARATAGNTEVTKQGENWYMLTLKPAGDAIRHQQRFTRDLSKAIEKAGGWLNPIVLNGPDRTYIFDLAASDEAKTREEIAKALRGWGISKFELTVKPDGIFPGS